MPQFPKPERSLSSADAVVVNELESNDFGAWDRLPFLNLSLWVPAPTSEITTTAPTACRTWLREPFCGGSHLFGAVAAVIACIALLRLTVDQPTRVIVAAALYGGSLIALYLASGLYHSLHGTLERIEFLRRLDLSAIFLLIAGTFAPLCLVTLHGPLGWVLLTVEYTLALTGVALVLLRLPLPDWVRVGMYLIMGWLSILVLKPLQFALPTAGVTWYVAGGLLYTLGTVVFATDRPHLWPGRFSAHDLWHLFVLLGSLCHFILIYHYVFTPLPR